MTPQVRTVTLTLLLMGLTTSAARAQAVSATSPARDAAAQSWVHESWTVKDGLPVNSINTLLQDRTGEAIHQGLADPDFGVGELADAVSQDRSHLFRRVKQLFGDSPSDLIRRMRVEAGERLLTEGSATVTDVAYAVGFNSLSYFCRCFQDVYGVTPAAYRSRASVASD